MDDVGEIIMDDLALEKIYSAVNKLVDDGEIPSTYKLEQADVLKIVESYDDLSELAEFLMHLVDKGEIGVVSNFPMMPADVAKSIQKSFGAYALYDFYYGFASPYRFYRSKTLEPLGEFIKDYLNGDTTSIKWVSDQRPAGSHEDLIVRSES